MIFLLDLPKPVHGMAVVNKAFINIMAKSFNGSVIINTAPSYASKYYNSPLWVIFKLLHNLWCYLYLFYILCVNSNKNVYRSINGGKGQIIDVFFIIIMRLFKQNIFIHHHSYKYLNKKSKLFYVINILAGKNTVHIVLASPMKTLLCDQYLTTAENVIVLSNLALLNFVTPEVRAIDNKVLKIGFLSNCSSQKGIDIFLDICFLLKANNINFSAKIAGPIVNKKTLKLINSAIGMNNNISYLGSLYGEHKNQFYKEIDCFVFPTRYEHEAEPVVLYEAANYGALLVATKKGAIEHVLSNLAGISVSSTNTVNTVSEAIIHSMQNNMFNYSNRLLRKKLFENQKEIEEISIIDLIKKFS